MSALSEDAIAREGLMPALEARRRGDDEGVRSLATTLDRADLLAVGALADLLRAEEVGGAVRVYAGIAPEAAANDVVHVRRDAPTAGDDSGIRFLRSVALARITGPRAARVRVDWSEVGVELAQVAPGFGASELVGPITTKRGLAIAADATKKVKGEGMVSLQAMKGREIAGLVRRSGRDVVVVGPGGIESDPPEVVHEAGEAT